MKVKVNLQYDFEYEGFIADCPALPGCMSQGKTRKEALKNIHEAVEGYIEVMKKNHHTVPLETIKSDYVEVRI